MSVDEAVKLILAISFAFAVIGIAYSLIKLILKVTDVVEDARKPVQNVGSLSDMLLEDYDRVRGVIDIIEDVGLAIKNIFSDPVNILSKIFKSKNKDR